MGLPVANGQTSPYDKFIRKNAPVRKDTAMQPEELWKLRSAEPFQPFRLTLIGGRTVDVPHRELMLVGRTALTIGLLDRESGEPIYDRLVTIALSNIEQVDMLAQAGA